MTLSHVHLPQWPRRMTTENESVLEFQNRGRNFQRTLDCEEHGSCSLASEYPHDFLTGRIVRKNYKWNSSLMYILQEVKHCQNQGPEIQSGINIDNVDTEEVERQLRVGLPYHNDGLYGTIEQESQRASQLISLLARRSMTLLHKCH